MSKIHPADAIKISAIITAAPRLVTALMRAEGFEIPVDWLAWWKPMSALSNLGMAVLEGAAFAYVFSAWRVAPRGPQSRNLMALAIIAAGLFATTVSPSVYVSSRGTLIGQTLPDWALWIWSASVTLSTIAVVASVGYATKPVQPQDTPTRPVITVDKVEKNDNELTPPENVKLISETPAAQYAREKGVSIATAYRRLRKPEKVTTP